MSGRANHPWVDETRAPLYIVTPPDCTEGEVDLLYRSCELVYAGLLHDVAWVFDTTETHGLSPRGRRIVAEHLRRNEAVMKAYVAGIAVVIPSAVMRGVYTAITWLVPLSFPHEVVQTREEGVRWAEQALVARRRLRAGEPPSSGLSGKP